MALPANDFRPEFILLADEILNDPAGIGYGAMADAAAASAALANTQDNWVTLESAEIFEALDAAEFQGLNQSLTARADRILGLSGPIATAPGSQARAEMIAVFGGGSTTIGNLATLANQQTNRAALRGIPANIVTAANVAYVRS